MLLASAGWKDATGHGRGNRAKWDAEARGRADLAARGILGDGCTTDLSGPNRVYRRKGVQGPIHPNHQ